MHNQLAEIREQAARLLAPTVSTGNYSRRSAMGKAIAKQDQAAELQARQNHNAAKVILSSDNDMHVIEKQRANARAELTQQAMMNARAINDMAGHLSNGNAGLDMVLGELQAAHNTGEVMRIIKRGAGE